MDTQQVKVLDMGGKGYDGIGVANLETAADIRADVGDVKSEFKGALIDSNTQRQTADLFNITRTFEAEKASLITHFDLKYHIVESERRLGDKIDNFKVLMADKFSVMENARLNDKIAVLESQKADGVNGGILSTLNAILAKLA